MNQLSSDLFFLSKANGNNDSCETYIFPIPAVFESYFTVELKAKYTSGHLFALKYNVIAQRTAEFL